MSVASIKAGRAFYEILAEDRTDEGLKDAEWRLMRFGQRLAIVGAAMTGVAAAGLASFVALAKGFADTGDVLGDAMGQTGFSGEFLQSLKYGAADVGVEFNLLRGAISKSQKSIAEAAAGSKSATKIFDLLGISVAQLSGLSPDDQFLAIADAIARIPNPAQRAEAAMAAFGKAGAKLLPMLNGGAQGLLDTLNSLKGSGLIFSEKDIALAGEADATFLRFSTTLKQLRDLVGAAIAPAFIAVMKPIQAAAEAVAKFINNNRQLIVWSAGGLVVIGVLGLAFLGLSSAILFSFAAQQLFALGLAEIIVLAGVLTSPLAVITAAIIACGVAAGVSAYYLDNLFNEGRGLTELTEAALAAQTAMQLLMKSIVSGRWDLAGKLIGQQLTLGFQGAIIGIKELWNGMIDYMMLTVLEAVRRIEAHLPQWIQERLGLGQVVAGGLDQAGNMVRYDLSGDQAAIVSSVADLAKTISEIQAVDKAGNDRLQKLFSGIMAPVLDSAVVAPNGAVGTFNSAAGALLGFAAPAATIEEKQLDAQIMGNKLLEDIIDGIDGLEGLTAD